jgi:hypothetical protein
MTLELILTDIELSENTTNDNTFDVWYNKSAKTFLAVEVVEKVVGKVTPRQIKYRLLDTFQNIATNHRQEILEYRLGRVTPQDEVTIGDIFMHAKFTEKI